MHLIIAGEILKTTRRPQLSFSYDVTFFLVLIKHPKISIKSFKSSVNNILQNFLLLFTNPEICCCRLTSYNLQKFILYPSPFLFALYYKPKIISRKLVLLKVKKCQKLQNCPLSLSPPY